VHVEQAKGCVQHGCGCATALVALDDSARTGLGLIISLGYRVPDIGVHSVEVGGFGSWPGLCDGFGR